MIVPLIVAGGAGGAAALLYVLVVRGALTLDLNIGRRVRPLGPITQTIAAPPETVFDVVAGPYLGRTPRAMGDKLQVLERGNDTVLAAHFTKLGPLTVTTDLARAGHVLREEQRTNLKLLGVATRESHVRLHLRREAFLAVLDRKPMS